MMTYKDIVFAQYADDTAEPERILAEEGEDALFEYLRQWETGDEILQETDTVPWGAADEVIRYPGGYVMTINSCLPYYGLVKVVTEVEA